MFVEAAPCTMESDSSPNSGERSATLWAPVCWGSLWEHGAYPRPGVGGGPIPSHMEQRAWNLMSKGLSHTWLKGNFQCDLGQAST